MFARVAGFAAFTFTVVVLGLASPASAADQITLLTKVAIEAGNLIIEGKTRRAGQTVNLDDSVATTVSDGNKNFRFELVYLPPDCVVDLKVGTVVKTAVVANCGPKGVNPKGAWKSTTSYLTDDLVNFQGSSWRAKNDSRNRRPDAYPKLWEKFAARGARGTKGDQGPPGSLPSVLSSSQCSDVQTTSAGCSAKCPAGQVVLNCGIDAGSISAGGLACTTMGIFRIFAAGAGGLPSAQPHNQCVGFVQCPDEGQRVSVTVFATCYTP